MKHGLPYWKINRHDTGSAKREKKKCEVKKVGKKKKKLLLQGFGWRGEPGRPLPEPQQKV